MDSLMLYLSICQNGQSKTGNKKLEYVDQIVGAIYSEIVVFPFEMKKSSLMVEIMKMYEMVNRTGGYQNIKTQITSLDAYIILKRLKDKINNENMVGAISSETLEYVSRMFQRLCFQNTQQKEWKAMGTYLKEIQQFLT